jgi:multiple sugar transport system substrate-binding protein
MRLRSRPGAAPWVLALLCVSACVASEPAPSRVDVQTITWYTSVSVEENPIAILVEDFERAHPTIRVNAVPSPDGTDAKRTKIREAIKNGINAPDVYLGDVIWPAEFGGDHLALPLDDVFGDEVWKRFPPELVSAASYAGMKYAVPFHSDQGLLYYRSDLVKPEEVPRTWEDLAAMARELQNTEGFEHGFVWQGKRYEGLTCNWLETVSAAGGQVLENEGVRSRMTSPESVRALRFMRQLIAEEVTPRDVAHFQEPDSTKLFASGKAPFMRGWNSAYSGIKKRLGQEADGMVGVARLPTFSGQSYPGRSTVGGWSLYVNPNTEKLDAVKEFVDWLTDAPAQRIVARYSLIPTNRDVRSDGTVMGANPALRVVLEGATSPEGPRLVTRPSNTPAYPDLSKAIYVNIHRALTGEATPEQALADADREINTTLERLSAPNRPMSQPGFN